MSARGTDVPDNIHNETGASYRTRFSSNICRSSRSRADLARVRRPMAPISDSMSFQQLHVLYNLQQSRDVIIDTVFETKTTYIGVINAIDSYGKYINTKWDNNSISAHKFKSLLCGIVFQKYELCRLL